MLVIMKKLKHFVSSSRSKEVLVCKSTFCCILLIFFEVKGKNYKTYDDHIRAKQQIEDWQNMSYINCITFIDQQLMNIFSAFFLPFYLFQVRDTRIFTADCRDSRHSEYL